MNALELFLSEVDQDMRANQTKIDIYMRDLRKHALDEYEDLYRDEQEQIKQGRSAEGKKKRKKRKRKNKNAQANANAAGGEGDNDQDEVESNPDENAADVNEHNQIMQNSDQEAQNAGRTAG